MTRSLHVSPDSDAAVSHGTIWFALLGGAVAWTLHLLLSYAVAEFGCLSGWGDVRWGGLSAVAWLLLGVSAGSLLLATAATYVAVRLRRNGARGREAQSGGDDTPDFSGRLALVTNLAFTLVIAVQSVPVFFYLRNC